MKGKQYRPKKTADDGPAPKVKPKSRRARRAIEAREPKLVRFSPAACVTAPVCWLGLVCCLTSDRATEHTHHISNAGTVCTVKRTLP